MGVLKKRSPEPMTLIGLLACWADTKTVVTFPLWLVTLDDSVLQSSVVCPRSWWYWQWRLWLHLKRFPPILFGHLKYGSFLIFFKTWCTSFQNTVLTTWGAVDSDCPTKSFWGLLLLYLSNLKSLLSWGITLPFPLPCYWSSSTLLYSSMRSISWRTLLTGFLVRIFLNHAR